MQKMHSCEGKIEKNPYILIMIPDLWTVKKLIPMAEKFLQEAISADMLLFFTSTFSVPH